MLEGPSYHPVKHLLGLLSPPIALNNTFLAAFTASSTPFNAYLPPFNATSSLFNTFILVFNPLDPSLLGITASPTEPPGLSVAL